MKKKISLCVLCFLLLAGCAGGKAVQETGATPVASSVSAISAPAEKEAQSSPTIVQPEEPARRERYEELTAQQRRSLNVFLSNFSETNPMLEDFDADSPDETAIVEFLYTNVLLNLTEKLKVVQADLPELAGDNIYEALPEEEADKLTRYYFDDMMLHHPVSSESAGMPFAYHNGAYYFPACAGIQITRLSIAESYIPLDEETVKVQFTVYRAKPETVEAYGLKHGSTVPPEFYEMTAQEARQETTYLEPAAKGTAVLEEIEGKYKLTQMKIAEK